jgi:hypothetical protein
MILEHKGKMKVAHYIYITGKCLNIKFSFLYYFKVQAYFPLLPKNIHSHVAFAFSRKSDQCGMEVEVEIRGGKKKKYGEKSD